VVLQLPPRPNDTLEGNGRLKQVKVFVCTETCNLNGYTYCLNHHRLLDTLNQGAVANATPRGKDFLQLVQAEVSFPNGDIKTANEANVRKSNILFVGEKSESQPAIPETQDRQLTYRVKPKTKLAVEIHLPLYVLRGDIYGEVWQQILDVVDRADKFIALTNCGVRRIQDNAELTFDFIAINRDKIVYVGEPTNSAESLVPNINSL
jgi:Family of unknown function (DUF6812)